jgi:CBS domain-containing protein
MRARDLVVKYPTIKLNESALAAARLMAASNLPGLIVVDEQGAPFTVLPGTQVLRLAVPQYCQQDPTLARVIDEAHADQFLRGLDDRTVAQCLPSEQRELAVVDPDATVLEIAALMARTRSPLVAVAAGTQMLGAVTLDRLLDRMLAK